MICIGGPLHGTDIDRVSKSFKFTGDPKITCFKLFKWVDVWLCECE